MSDARLSLKRVFRSGLINFWRNGTVSAASIFVITVALFIFGSLLLAGAFLESSLAQIQDKVDINIYFTQEASEGEILALKNELEGLPEVKAIEYLSRDQVLAEFLEKNKGNALVTQTLDELEENPFGAKFNIKARETSQYEGIAAFLGRFHDPELGGGGDSIIESVNYLRNKVVIDRLNNLITALRRLGLFTSILLALLAILVTFNTIRLAIYNSREEIEVMKLVGASPSFVRGPFIVEGILYGLVAGLITTVLFYPATFWLSRETKEFFGGLDLLSYYLNNFGQLFVVLTVAGVILGMISSFIAVRRYLK